MACGATFFDSAFSRTLLNHLSHNEQSYGISPREREVLVGIAEGLTSKEIASRLEIGVRTVDTHRERLTRKLNIHNAAGLTRFALQQGLVPQ